MKILINNKEKYDTLPHGIHFDSNTIFYVMGDTELHMIGTHYRNFNAIIKNIVVEPLRPWNFWKSYTKRIVAYELRAI